MAGRNALAVVYSSLIYASISVPYVYIAAGALSYFPLTAILIIVPWLVTSSWLLLTIFVSKSRAEDLLAHALGAYSRPLLVVLVLASMASSYFIGSKIANFSVLLPVEYWYYTIVMASIATAAAFIVVIAMRPSRLERFIASTLSRGIRYRVAGYIVLAAGVAFVGHWLSLWYRYKWPASP